MKPLSLTLVTIFALLFGQGAQPVYALDGSDGDAGYVIVQTSDAVVSSDGSMFIPISSYKEGDLVVIADSLGNLPVGLTEQKLAQMTSSSTFVPPRSTRASYAYYAYSTNNWSNAYSGWSAIGFNSSATVRYNFAAAGGTSQVNAGQGLGYYLGYNGSQYGVWSQWYNLGVASENGGGASVPWGNVAAVTKFRAKCATSTICGGYFWN